ncbi:opacity family porin, partial [Neisseria gonorrhoeae]|uniref:opacity family porin n=1 Tax=Neisseria gonorrhoeae TaxID=485 RepID=UPI0038500822
RKWNNNKYSVSIKELLRNDNANSGGYLNIQTRKTENQENGTFHAVSSLGLSAVYDFKLNDKFKPYIGMRVAYGHVRHQVHSMEKETTAVTTYPSNGGTPSVTTEAPTSKP